MINIMFVFLVLASNVFSGVADSIESATHKGVFAKIIRRDSLIYAIIFEKMINGDSTLVANISADDMADTAVAWEFKPTAMSGDLNSWQILFLSSKKWVNPHMIGQSTAYDSLWSIKIGSEKELVLDGQVLTNLQHLSRDCIYEVKFWPTPSFFTVTMSKFKNFSGGFENSGHILFYGSGLKKEFKVYKSELELIKSVSFFAPDDFNLMTQEFKVKIQTDKNLHCYNDNLTSIKNNAKLLKFVSYDGKAAIFDLKGRKISPAKKIGSGLYIAASRLKKTKMPAIKK